MTLTNIILLCITGYFTYYIYSKFKGSSPKEESEWIKKKKLLNREREIANQYPPNQVEMTLESAYPLIFDNVDPSIKEWVNALNSDFANEGLGRKDIAHAFTTLINEKFKSRELRAYSPYEYKELLKTYPKIFKPWQSEDSDPILSSDLVLVSFDEESETPTNFEFWKLITPASKDMTKSEWSGLLNKLGLVSTRLNIAGSRVMLVDLGGIDLAKYEEFEKAKPFRVVFSPMVDAHDYITTVENEFDTALIDIALTLKK